MFSCVISELTVRIATPTVVYIFTLKQHMIYDMNRRWGIISISVIKKWFYNIIINY